jgi:hypothetical protein
MTSLGNRIMSQPDGQHQAVDRRVHVETHDFFYLSGKSRISRALEWSDAVRLSRLAAQIRWIVLRDTLIAFATARPV